MSRRCSPPLPRLHPRPWGGLAIVAVVLLAGCGSSGTSAGNAGDAVGARWVRARHVRGVVDLTGPRRNGELTVTAAGQLLLFRPGGALSAFARGPNGYRAGAGDEPYIALAPAGRQRGAGCSFGRDAVYALSLGPQPGVVMVDRDGRSRRFADLPTGETPKGIAFDEVGRFGHSLLVTGADHGKTDVVALDCHGGIRTVTRAAPRLEGGIAIAPRSFKRYAGQLIAPDEKSGKVIAIDARGGTRTIASSGLPTGGDIGIESAGFVPRGLGRAGAAYVADRGVPGNPHPGTDSILMLRATALARAGVGPGDLLIASEGGGKTIALRCRTTCTVRHIADGPSVAHVEGHIVFGPAEAK